MLFNSLEFMLFFPIVTTLYFIIPHKYRWAMLLGASCIFYMAFIPAYILILAVTICIDYAAGIMIDKTDGKRKKIFLLISIISTCLVLFIFKYYNFFNNSFASIASFFHLKYPVQALNIILPIGLSFHTFQSLSYVIEVYRGLQKSEKHFGIYALYVMFYPQLVAGPIERPQNLLHQFREKHYFDYQRVVEGLKLMVWGLFKKAVIADRLAVVVNQVYGSPAEYNGIALIIATVFFAFQIFCDFSGYSDIAIGAAKVMGLPDGEFQPALFLQKYIGILETVAYFFVNLVQGLLLYFHWRKPCIQMEMANEPFPYVFDKRIMAWGKLDIRNMGSFKWVLSCICYLDT